jgi:YVTN family beta-propeller protein
VYVAELGNNSVGVVDLQQRKLIRTIGGFDEPQGVAYDAGSDSIYVANGGDGSLRVFRGDDFAPIAKIALGDDADNVRVDSKEHRVYVGYGNGALAVIDTSTRKKMATIPLKGHPESFQLEPGADRIFVNVPDAAQIAVVSRAKGQQVASWPTQHLQANYPLAIDLERDRVIPIFRKPARLEIFDATSGRDLGGVEACGDADDVFVDSRRKRVYVICGEGYVDTVDTYETGLQRMARVPTSAGSRTGLFLAELDRVIVAIRAQGSGDAELWVLQPSPAD